jgi:hypothetical protein
MTDIDPTSSGAQLRESLIDAGVLRPAQRTGSLTLRPVYLPPDRVVLRLDAAGRTAAARCIATGLHSQIIGPQWMRYELLAPTRPGGPPVTAVQTCQRVLAYAQKRRAAEKETSHD